MISLLYTLIQAFVIGVIVIVGALACAGTVLYAIGKLDQEADHAGEE